MARESEGDVSGLVTDLDDPLRAKHECGIYICPHEMRTSTLPVPISIHAFPAGERQHLVNWASYRVMFCAALPQVADFGTTRWIQHTVSTGLATYTTQRPLCTHMSFPWTAPEVSTTVDLALEHVAILLDQ